MKKYLTTFLLLAFLATGIFTLYACQDGVTDGDNESGGGNNDDEAIIVPEYKDYLRGTVNFSDISYQRPDIDQIISDFDAVCSAIEENTETFEKQLEMIKALEDGYNELLTMRSYANILAYKDTSNAYWQAENEYISTNFPSFSKSVENMLVTAANSAHAERFEEEYFQNDLIATYKDGGKYTDEVVELMEAEAELESRYSSLSTANVTIAYKFKRDTVDNILAFYADSLGINSEEYKTVETDCLEIYESEVQKLSEELLVDLFKIRRDISDEFGHTSYAEFAYDVMDHEYSESDFENFLCDISRFLLPVYQKLSSYIFNQYDFSNRGQIEQNRLINGTADIMKNADAKLYEIYSYMLQHSLFDVSPSSSNRFDGAFTAYLDSYNAPFIFISTEGDVTDYTVLCHEFGHFADYYINYSASTSLDLSEVSSQALELLALTQFDGILSEQTVNNLTLYKIEQTLSCIIFQGFYAAFEHIAYDIPKENISIETLNDAVKTAATTVGLNSNVIDALGYVTIPHIFLYPFYVQSYCTSAALSLEIYFAELNDDGSGFEVYMELLDRGEDKLTFDEHLERVGLTSPLESDYLRVIADRIHYELMGSHYFKDYNGGENAA
ncbi:MAG: hypothetical protein E7612_01790 [Ruminococcaceae bacterium]|nr:hypothetical protein [Oscillospiraceae bacterium]